MHLLARDKVGSTVGDIRVHLVCFSNVQKSSLAYDMMNVFSMIVG